MQQQKTPSKFTDRAFYKKNHCIMHTSDSVTRLIFNSSKPEKGMKNKLPFVVMKIEAL